MPARLEFERNEVQMRLQDFLNSRKAEIGLMRAWRQIQEGEFRLDPEQLAELEKEITGIKSPLDHRKSSLCEIRDFSTALQHEGRLGFPDSQREKVKGFFFRFIFEGEDLLCVIMDGSGSSRYFNLMDETNQRRFMQRFGYGPRVYDFGPGELEPYIDQNSKPLAWVVFASEEKDRIGIKKIVPLRELLF